MLNTSTWTTSLGRANALYEPTLITDFEAPELESIPVRGITHTSLPTKPYVYGQSTAYARRQLLRAALQVAKTAG